MLGSRIFQVTLLISVLVHGVILVQNAHFPDFSKSKNDEEVKVNYLKKTPQEKPRPKNNFAKKIKREPFLKIPEKITVENKLPPPFIEKNNPAPAAPGRAVRLKADTNRPALIQADALYLKKKISLPEIADPQKINNPSYMSYYQLVREKIRRAAFRNYNGREIGEVTLSFVISSEGDLQRVMLIEGTSVASGYLEGIAVSSVKTASPFPAFPKELNYSYLPFKLAIVFEVE